MPTYDGGHCFLTALLPISTKFVETGSSQSSPVHLVRDALSSLAPAHQTLPTMGGPDSPFADDNKTHFARFAVIDDTIYNGRRPTDAIFDQSDRLIAQPIDQLNCPYLLFVADFDAPEGSPSELQDYLENLWNLSPEEFGDVFKHCHKFPKNPNARDFADFVARHQIETTMPFNDYRPDDTPLKSRPAKVSNSTAGRLVKYAIGAVYVALCCGLYVLLDHFGLILDDDYFKSASFLANVWYYLWPVAFSAQILLIIITPGVVVAALGYALVSAVAAKPFLRKPGSDLPSVLKALYLQRKFIHFVIDAQDKKFDDAALQAEFLKFVKACQPENINTPSLSQPAGAIPQ